MLALLVVGEKACFKHGPWRHVVVTATNHVDMRLWADLDDLEVVRETNLEVALCLTIVDLALGHLVVLSIIHQNLLRVLIKYVDELRHGGVQVWDVLCLGDVGQDLFLDAVLRHLVVLADLVADLDMLKHLLVLLDGSAAWACELKHVEYFLHVTMKCLWLLFASAAIYRTLPSVLHLDAVLTEEQVTLWALLWIRLGDELAQLAHELIDCA